MEARNRSLSKLEILISYVGVLFSYFNILANAWVSGTSWVALLLAQITLNAIALISMENEDIESAVRFTILQFSFLTQLVTLAIGLLAPLGKVIVLSGLLLFYDLDTYIMLIIKIIEGTTSLSMTSRYRSLSVLFVALLLTLLYFWFRQTLS